MELTDFYRSFTEDELVRGAEYYFADELITEERLNETNKCLEDAGVGSISRRQLSYSLGSYLAYQDRITILGILSKRFNMAFATGKMPENVRKLLIAGTGLFHQNAFAF